MPASLLTSLPSMSLSSSFTARQAQPGSLCPRPTNAPTQPTRGLPAHPSRRNLLCATTTLLVCSSAAHGRGDLRAAAAEAVAVETLRVGDTQDAPPAQPFQPVSCGPPAYVKASGRIVAIGDLHGDLQKTLACLELAGVLAEDDGHVRWVGGEATVVQLGDVLDRGDSEISTVLLLRELDRQARKQGGAVWMLNGNHESLNVAGDFRYVTPGAFWESAVAAGMTEQDIATDRQAVLRARWALYRPGGQMARELAKNPTVLVVNDLVFAHGGLLPHHPKYGLQRINDEVYAWMMGHQATDGSAPIPPFPAMGDANSVMWNRTFGKERASPYDRIHMTMQLDAVLKDVGAVAMVVGHTPQMSGVNTECDGRVWRVDAGMSSGVLNAEPQVLEFFKDAEGKMFARSLRGLANGSVEESLFVYGQQKSSTAGKGRGSSQRSSAGQVGAHLGRA